MKFKPLMAVVVDHHNGFKPPLATRKPQHYRCKQHRSFTQIESSFFFDVFDPTVLEQSLKQAVVVVTNMHRSFSTPCLSDSRRVEEDIDNNSISNSGPRVELVAGRGAPGIRALVVEAAIAMASGVDPVPISSGLGGAYYLCSRNGDKIAVAKPIDQKGFSARLIAQTGFKSSVRDGETGVREVAAYLLDHNGFSGVPPTALVQISHVAFHTDDSNITEMSKTASLQRFVDHDFDAGDLGPSGFSVSSVHRIGILDVRLLNLDRHAGNILVKKNVQEKDDHYVSESSYAVGSADLVPIDHGLCLPELLDDPYFEWLHWPQASLPFSESEVEYISQLDPLKDADLLRSELPSLRESSIRVLILCTTFLKFAASVAGICLADIGHMMTREFIGTGQEPSVLETLCIKAKASMKKTFEIVPSQEEEEMEMFQFDLEREDSYKDNEVLDLPRLLRSYPETKMTTMGKPPKIPHIKLPSTRSMSGFPHTVLSPLHEENNKYENEEESEEEETQQGNEDHEGGVGVGGWGLMKSVSFSISNQKCESEGISFKGMSDEEFLLFLDSFEKLLPKAFEERKKVGMKQRLGTSCEF